MNIIYVKMNNEKNDYVILAQRNRNIKFVIHISDIHIS